MDLGESLRNMLKCLGNFRTLCRYLAEGSNAIERSLWTITIATSFSLAGIMVSSNVRDLQENPISTAIETIPVQVANDHLDT